jgi:hypothetical protein
LHNLRVAILAGCLILSRKHDHLLSMTYFAAPRNAILFLICSVLLASSLLIQAQLPAFPGAVGAGAYATGGRGGDVYHVVNLNDSGVGSLRYGIENAPAAGRTIVFEVSGWIRIPSGGRIRVTKPKITIAGQTAPGDGIGLYNGTFWPSSTDLVVRQVRMRYGKQAAAQDCVTFDSGANRVIFDHCDFLFSTDENFSTWRPPDHVTMQRSINAWGLQSHSAGGLFDIGNATIYQSLWAHNHTRNPKARPWEVLDWVNNVTFDWNIGFIMGDSETPANWKVNARGSYFIAPPGNIREHAFQGARLDRNGNPNFFLHIDNCFMDHNGNGILDVSKTGYAMVSGSAYVQSATPFPTTGVPVTADNPLTAYKKVVSYAGPVRMNSDTNRPFRDEVAEIAINNLTTQTRKIISHQNELGAGNDGFGVLESSPAPVDSSRDGMPDYWKLALGMNPATQNHNTPVPAAPASFMPVAGYTALEEYLHFLAGPHGIVGKSTGAAPTHLDVDLRRYTRGFNKSPVTFSIANVVGGTVQLLGGHLARFAPTPDTQGRARFDFTVLDGDGSTWTQTFRILVSESGAPPEVSITSPGNFSTISNGQSITITAEVGPTVPVSRVRFFAGTSEPLTLLGEDTTAPYSFTFSPATPKPVNLYTLRAVAISEGGLTAQDSVTVKVIHPAYVIVTTADGSGADAELRENDNGDAGAGTSPTLNARFNNSTRNEIIALRFDLEATDRAAIDTAALQLTSHRGQDQTRNLRVYGVINDTTGGDNNGFTPGYNDNNWSESAVRFSTMPGLLWDGNSATRSLRTPTLVDLGAANAGGLSKGGELAYTSPALLNFLRSHPDQWLTLLISSDTVAEGQSRWAAKEATELESGSPSGPASWFAPRLSLRMGQSLPPGTVVTNVTLSAAADVELQENVPADAEFAVSTGANSTAMNTRTAGTNRNEIIALRFDLGDFPLANLANATLTVVQFRNGGAHQVALYGLQPDAAPSFGDLTVDTWAETSVEFATMPGLIFDEDSTTQGIDPSKTVPLGQITYTSNAKGGVETFSNSAITSFLQNYAGGNRVTFLLAAAPGYSNTGQARIASKEATALDGGSPTGPAGTFAPRLNFQATLFPPLEITSASCVGDQLTLTWSGGQGPYTVEMQTALWNGWTNALTGILGTNATLTISGDAGFFRVRGQ